MMMGIVQNRMQRMKTMKNKIIETIYFIFIAVFDSILQKNI